MNKVDINEIVRRSLHEAKKTHGYIVEAEEPQAKTNSSEADYPPFDREKHMPNIDIAGKAWGRGDRAENSVQELNSYIDSIRAGSNNFKDFLKNFNKSLGMNMNTEGDPLPIDIEADNFNLSQVVSALVLRKLMVSIIRKNKGGAAGDIWEGLYARLLGGETTEEKEIEDIKYNPKDDALLSLKMMSESDAKIKGSKLSLAISLAKYNPTGPTRIPVRYIVGTKLGKEESVFKIKFSSFDLTKENYFQWIFRNTKPNPKDIGKFITVVTDTIQQNKKGSPAEFVAPTAQDLRLDFETFLKTNKSPEKEKALNNVNISLQQIERDIVLLNLVKKITGMEDLEPQEFYSKFLYKNYFAGGAKKAAKADLFVLLEKILTIFSGQSLEDYIKSHKQNPLDPRQQEFFTKQKEEEQQALKMLIFSLDDLNKEFKKEQKLHKDALAVQATQQHSADIINQNIQKSIEDFWNMLASLGENKPQLEGNESKFQINLSSVDKLDFISSDYDYEPILIDPTALFISSKKMVQSFKEYAEPIYRDRYYMDIALRKYFVDDKPEGMLKFEEVLKQTDADIKVLLNTTGQGGEKYKKASSLKENKKGFTRNYIDDILDDL